jgi:hypothetical protein
MAVSIAVDHFVGLAEPPHLIGVQAEISGRLAEWLAVVDRIEELLADLGWQSLLRPCSPASSLVVRVRRGA